MFLEHLAIMCLIHPSDDVTNPDRIKKVRRREVAIKYDSQTLRSCSTYLFHIEVVLTILFNFFLYECFLYLNQIKVW